MTDLAECDGTAAVAAGVVAAVGGDVVIVADQVDVDGTWIGLIPIGTGYHLAGVDVAAAAAETARSFESAARMADYARMHWVAASLVLGRMNSTAG